MTTPTIDLALWMQKHPEDDIDDVRRDALRQGRSVANDPRPMSGPIPTAKLDAARNRLAQQAQPGAQFSDSYNDQGGTPGQRFASGAMSAVKGIPQGLMTMGQMALEATGPEAYKPTLIQEASRVGDRLSEAHKAFGSGEMLGGAQRLAEAIPLAGGVGQGIAQSMATGDEAGALGQGVGNLAIMGFGEQVPKIAPKIAAKVAPFVEARRAANAADLTKVSSAATNDVIGILGKNKLTKALGAETAPSVQEALSQLSADGTMKDIIGEGDGMGTNRRLHTGLDNLAAQHYEFTKGNYVNQVGKLPIKLSEAGIKSLKHVFGDPESATSLADSTSASAVQKALEQGYINAEDAYPLKAKLNAIARPMHENAVGIHDAATQTIAHNASAELQAAIKDLLDKHVGMGQGDAFLASDMRAGKSAVLRRAASSAADSADVTNPSSDASKFAHRAVTAAGGIAGAALGNAIGGHGLGAMGGVTGVALGDALATKFGPALHPDIALANALGKVRANPATRPAIPAELAANLRPSDPAVFAQGRQSPQGTNVALSPPPEVTNLNPNLVGDFETSGNARERGPLGPRDGRSFGPLPDQRMTIPEGGIPREGESLFNMRRRAAATELSNDVRTFKDAQADERVSAAKDKMDELFVPGRENASVYNSPDTPGDPMGSKKIYDRTPKQVLGDRGTPQVTYSDVHDAVTKQLDKKIDYDTRNQFHWKPDAGAFTMGEGIPHRFTNPKTGGVETWTRLNGKVVKMAP